MEVTFPAASLEQFNHEKALTGKGDWPETQNTPQDLLPTENNCLPPLPTQ